MNGWVIVDLILAVIEAKLYRPELRKQVDEYRAANPDADLAAISKFLRGLEKSKIAETQDKIDRA